MGDKKDQKIAELEAQLEKTAMDALGLMLAECCTTLDAGGDPRKTEVPDMMDRYKADMEKAHG